MRVGCVNSVRGGDLAIDENGLELQRMAVCKSRPIGGPEPAQAVPSQRVATESWSINVPRCTWRSGFSMGDV